MVDVLLQTNTLASGSNLGPGQRLAVVIGVNASADPDLIPPLQSAEADALNMGEVLATPACGFTVTKLIGEMATAQTVRRTIRRLLKSCSDDDLLVIYFSGHADPVIPRRGGDQFFFVTSDYHPEDASDDPELYFSMAWLWSKVYQIEEPGHVLLLLDCCYAGRTGSSAADPLQIDFRGLIEHYRAGGAAVQPDRLRVILSATGSHQPAYEGVMTHYILALLQGTTINELPEDGRVTTAALCAHVHRSLRSEHGQEPVQEGRLIDRFILADHSVMVAAAHAADLQRSKHDRLTTLRSLLHNHHSFMNGRLVSFVGREQELAQIGRIIEERQPFGGYVTITGKAGQGKSSIIAKLVATALKQYTDEHVVYHFIPLNPGPDYHIGLLRNLMARLCLKYNLVEIYVASDSRPALRDYFARILEEVAGQGGQEIIYIDGLDQLEEDLSGVRDLSFLPINPPTGILFVLGTRPNDTLRPLELLKPYHEYPLPDLSRTDFDLLLRHRGVTLTPGLANQFYAAMERNALYLDLVAKELAEAGNLAADELIGRIADNPENLFSFAIERLRRNLHHWREVIKPILGVLLAAQEPLHMRVLRNLVGVDDQDVREGLQRLGGLVDRDSEGRYALYHLKFRDYLRQDETLPSA